MSDHTSERKAHHIDLAYKSQVTDIDSRFDYEPVLSAHPTNEIAPFSFLGKTMNNPLWVSSMTGGTEKAGTINENLARAVGKYGLGMGLGSCRIILESDEYLPDFQLRKFIGSDFPFYANLGIAQLEELIDAGKTHLIKQLIDRTETNGLIIHVNPFQEWLQPEGDRYQRPAIDTIKQIADAADFPIIVKEVGQGMGKESLKALMELPISGIDFGSHGGTNFSAVELFRAHPTIQDHFSGLANIGHSAEEMVTFCNDLIQENPSFGSKEFIISGGIQNFLDGYYHQQRLQAKSVYAQASALLKHAEVGFDKVDEYVEKQMEGYRLAQQFLTLKKTQ